MIAYLLRRLLAFVPTLLVVALLIALMLELVPGDPVGLMLGMEASGDALIAKRHELGLDKPFAERLLNWFIKAARGDLGESLFLRQSVSSAIAERLPITISVAALSLVVAVVVGVAAGIVASVRQGGIIDWVAMVFALVVLSVPSFWLALNLIFFFAVKLRWLPVGGYVPLTEDPAQYLVHLFLPCMSLGLGHAAIIARMTRTSMLEVLRTDYIRTAQAKGLRQQIVILRHAFKNALIPVVTVIGLGAGALLGGSVITETVYNLPGLGRLIVEAVRRRDYFVVQGGILIVTGIYLLVNLIVDVLYVWIDPRIRYDAKR